MKISIFVISVTFFYFIQVETDARSLSKAVSSNARKRQFVSNPTLLGSAFVKDNAGSRASPPEAGLTQASGNSGDKSTEFQGTTAYKDAGCFKDAETRAVPLLEGSDPELSGFYKERQDPISKCASVAKSRGYQLFAIQNGGMCLSGPNAQDTYKTHGIATDCKDGKGGPWANNVYIFNDFPLEIHTFTGTLPNAGTDANVYVSLSGSMGSSRRISLTPEGADQNPFEAGQQDVFNVHTIPLGSISRVTIGHDDSGQVGQQTSSWYLEKVVVKDAANNMYKFQVNRWLAKDQDDGQVERELSLTSTIKPGLYKPLGCFKERTDVNKDRAVPSLEGRDEMLDGQGAIAYRDREFPVEKCADAARRRGYVMFAIQDGGLCATSKEIQNTYEIYGAADDCRSNGTGATFSSTVYTFADQEPGFKEAEGTAAAVAKGTDTLTSQPVPPSDPAMQVTGQAQPAQTGTSGSTGQAQPAQTGTNGSKEAGQGSVTPTTSSQTGGTTLPGSTPGTSPSKGSQEKGSSGKLQKNPESAPSQVTQGTDSNQTGTKPGTASAGTPATSSGGAGLSKPTGISGTGTTKPDTSTGTSGSGTTKPDTSTGTSGSGTTKPDTSTGTTGSGTTKPDTSTGTSGSGATKPDTSKGTSGSGMTKPDTTTGTPGSGTTNPDTSTGKIDSGASKPDTTSGKPETGNSGGKVSTAEKNPSESSGKTSPEQSGSKANKNGGETQEAKGKNSEGKPESQSGEGQETKQTGTEPSKATPQQPKTHPSREDTKIPTPAAKPNLGGVSPLIETPLIPRVYKIAPESRLPGEYTSPKETNTAFLKSKTEKEPMAFNKLLLDNHHQEGNYEFFPRKH